MLRNCCVSCWDVQVPCTCTHVQRYAQSSSSQCAWSQSSRFFEFEQWFKMDLRVKARKRRKKNKWRSLKTSQTCGEIDISNSKSLFYHTPNAQARNCGKMHVSDPFFIKRTWIFCCDKMKNAHILLQITLFCSISLWNDLSVRVVTCDWTVVISVHIVYVYSKGWNRLPRLNKKQILHVLGIISIISQYKEPILTNQYFNGR